MALFAQLVLNGLVQGAVLTGVAVGFGLVYRSLRVFHVAVGAGFVLSSYLFYFATSVWQLPPVPAVAFTLTGSTLAALILEGCVYRPFFRRGCPGGATMIASLGVLVIVENALALLFGNEVKTIPHPPVPAMAFFGLHLTWLQFLQLTVSLAVFATVGLFLRRMRIAKAAWALGDDCTLAEILGLPVGRIRLFVLVLSALVTALAAMLVSADTGMSPHDGLRWMLAASVAVFFGGRDHYWAWGVGAMFLAVVQSAAVWALPAEWSEPFAYALMLTVLVFFPRGLFATARRPEETA